MLEYWPDTAAAVEIFFTVGTQWRVGAGGATGLDYCAVYPLLDRLGLSARDWNYLLSDIQVMESAALAVMSIKD